ncbi:hypothetical protein MVEN_02290200 [Mycena venus]|uniref:Uncharacterized protein n=1 Tax=Mycena venus TaxID=2733690 RepID=A0A8H7CG13_9AGAR|nr:hypothetical protein MVEN_02290200 [Mycena venus]
MEEFADFIQQAKHSQRWYGHRILCEFHRYFTSGAHLAAPRVIVKHTVGACEMRFSGVPPQYYLCVGGVTLKPPLPRQYPSLVFRRSSSLIRPT